MILVNEGIVESGIVTNEIQLDPKDKLGNYTITVRQQKNRGKMHEHSIKFTQNGLAALLAGWAVESGFQLENTEESND